MVVTIARSVVTWVRAVENGRQLQAHGLGGSPLSVRTKRERLRAARDGLEHVCERDTPWASSSRRLLHLVKNAEEVALDLGVLELLDAYRGEMDDALTRLDLAHQARRARLDFDRLTEVTPP